MRVKQPAVEHRVRDEGFQAVAGEPGEGAGRVREEEEADGVGERGRAGAMSPNYGMPGPPCQQHIC